MGLELNIDKPKQITIFISIVAIVGLACIYFAVKNIEPTELEIGAIEDSIIGKLVKITGRIENIRKSRSGNSYWTVDDGNSITVPILDGKFKKLNPKRGDTVTVLGIVSEYNGELEVMPKEIYIR